MVKKNSGEVKILNCAHCGGKPLCTTYFNVNTGEVPWSAEMISCETCGIRTRRFKRLHSAIEAWNKRAP